MANERNRASTFEFQNAQPKEVSDFLQRIIQESITMIFPRPYDLDSTEPLDSFLDTLYVNFNKPYMLIAHDWWKRLWLQRSFPIEASLSHWYQDRYLWGLPPISGSATDKKQAPQQCSPVFQRIPHQNIGVGRRQRRPWKADELDDTRKRGALFDKVWPWEKTRWNVCTAQSCLSEWVRRRTVC